MAESKVTGIEAMVQLRHIDAPLAGLHRSFDTKILHKKAMRIYVQLTKTCKESFLSDDTLFKCAIFDWCLLLVMKLLGRGKEPWVEEKEEREEGVGDQHRFQGKEI